VSLTSVSITGSRVTRRSIPRVSIRIFRNFQRHLINDRAIIPFLCLRRKGRFRKLRQDETAQQLSTAVVRFRRKRATSPMRERRPRRRDVTNGTIGPGNFQNRESDVNRGPACSIANGALHNADTSSATLTRLDRSNERSILGHPADHLWWQRCCLSVSKGLAFIRASDFVGHYAPNANIFTGGVYSP